MKSNLLLHPMTTFVGGAALALGGAGLFLSSCAGPNRSAEEVATYRNDLAKAGTNGPAPGTAEEKAAIERFTTFLKNIGNQDFIRENTSKTYSADAFLNDTLTTHHGAADIGKYFVKTSEAMTEAQVTIDDISRSGPDHYIRWTMVIRAPALSNGEPVHSIGISQVRFDSSGKVAFHQDFWDSGGNFYGKLPVAGGIIGFIKKRLQ